MSEFSAPAASRAMFQEWILRHTERRVIVCSLRGRRRSGKGGVLCKSLRRFSGKAFGGTPKSFTPIKKIAVEELIHRATFYVCSHPIIHWEISRRFP